MVAVHQIDSLGEAQATSRGEQLTPRAGHSELQRSKNVRSRLDVARYRRRMVVVILVATVMVCVKLVAMSWKGGSTAGRMSRVGQAKLGHARGAPMTRRAH
jgi:hypothetical protein